MTPESWFIKQQQYELLISQLQQALEFKDHEIEQLKKQLDKAKSVLSVTNPPLNVKGDRAIGAGGPGGAGVPLEEDEDAASSSVQDVPRKKQGVSGESSSKFSLGGVNSSRRLQDLEISKVEKDFRWANCVFPYSCICKHA